MKTLVTLTCMCPLLATCYPNFGSQATPLVQQFQDMPLVQQFFARKCTNERIVTETEIIYRRSFSDNKLIWEYAVSKTNPNITRSTIFTGKTQNASRNNDGYYSFLEKEYDDEHKQEDTRS